LYPNSIAPPTWATSRGTQLFAVRMRSVPSRRSSALPNVATRRVFRTSTSINDPSAGYRTMSR
jgi:hypothetical protein